jgi:hypothetical protein
VRRRHSNFARHCAKLNGLDPAIGLKETLEKRLTWPNSLIDELLPFGKLLITF